MHYHALAVTKASFQDICPVKSNQNNDSSELTETRPVTAILRLGQLAGIAVFVILMVDSSELTDLLLIPAVPYLGQLAAIAVSARKPLHADQQSQPASTSDPEPF